ncbi:MAG: PAS domain S-box protein, partial [Cyanobacteria bacterium]|nr:PAS domain S-box protein [Cyanobacteriota bacterium]
TVYGVLPPGLAKQQLDYAHQALETGQLQTFEHDFEFEGQHHYEEVRIAPLNDQDVLIVVRDISEQTQLATERARATAALVESERRFRTLFENTPKLAVQGYDRDRRVIYWNSASETLYGYSAAEAIGQPIETLIVPPEARPQVVGRLENWAREKAIPAGEIDLVAKDGTKLTVFSNHITLTNRAGELEFYCVDIDLGPLKQAEHQLQALNQSLEATVAARTADLQEREQFLQTVLDTFPLAVFWKDQDSLYQGGNRNFLRHAGLGSITEIIGKRDDQLPWSEAEAEAYRQQDRQIMASGTPLMGIVETQMQADGHQVWIETNKLPLRNLAGDVIGVLGTYQDITDRHQAEAALIQSEARQRAILATLPDYLFCLGTDGVYRDLVTYQPEIALFPADFNPVGLAMSDVLPPDIATLQLRYLEEALATGTLQTYEQQVPLEDGIRDEEVRVIQSGPDEALFMIRDISERARLEAERKHAAAQLRRYERVVSATIDGIALVDCNYIYQLANPTYLHLTGKTQDQVVGQSVEAVLGEVLGEPFFRLQIQPNLARCLAGECIQYEAWFDFAATGPRFMSVNYVPYRKLDGTIAGIVTNTRDITNLKQMQYTLGLATQQLQAFLVNAPVMISHFDDEGRYFQVNQTFAEQVGRPINEIVGRSFADLFPASTVAMFQERVQRVVETQQPLEVEDEVCINGEMKTFQTTLFAVKDLYQGRTMSFWAIAKEITDRKQAEAALKESEARWQFALEGAGDGVWDWNLQTNQVFFSHPWKAMLGFSDEEIGDSRQEWESRVHPDDLESCHDALQRHFRGEAPIYQREHRLRCRDGSYKWILTRGKVIEWGDQGQPLRMIGTHTDVSDLKQAETQLQEMTQRLTLATDSAQIGVWEWDVLTDRLIWDDCMYALYGQAPEDFGGVYGDWQRGLHPEDRPKADADIHAAIAGEKEFHPEFRVVWPDGQVRFIQAHAIVLRDHAGTPQRMIGVNWDITDRKQTEAALQNLMIDTAATTGQDFFAALARHIATALAVPYTIVNAHKDGELQTLAFCAEGTLQPNFVYNSVHTPCERTLQAGHFYCADQVQHHFPEDVDLVMMEAQSYLGIAFQDAEGHTIGELCILDKKPLQAPQRAQQILQIFAARAAAELQRQRATDALEQLNQTLEARVTQRTAALREQQMRYRTLMEGASDAILVIDFQGNFMEANDQAERLLGYPKAELTAMHITQLRASEDAATVLAHFEQVTRQARSQVLDVPLLRQDGAFVSVDVSASVIDINGEPIVQAIFRDISDRKRFEAERQRAEQDLQRLVLELSDFKFALDQSAIVVTTDAKGVITYANDRFCEISGYDREAILGRTHRLVNSGHHPPKFFQDLWRTIASGQVWRGEICNRNKKGELYWVESTLVPFLDAQGKPFQYLTIRFDITDRKQAEQTIRKQAEREKLLRETGELIRQSLDLLTIFNTACQEIQAVLQSDRVSIFQFGPISEFLQGEFVAESAVAGIRSVLETPVEDHCFGENYSTLYSQGRGFVSHDIHDQGLSPCHIDILAQFQVRA